MPDSPSDSHALPGAAVSTIKRVRIAQAMLPAQPSGRR